MRRLLIALVLVGLVAAVAVGLWWPPGTSRSRATRPGGVVERTPASQERARGLSLAALESSIDATAGYLRRHLDSRGRFVYLVNLDGHPVGERYNLLRHAGSVYALGQYYALRGDRATREAIIRAARYLKSEYMRAIPARPGLAGLWSRPEEEGVAAPTVKLGGTALGLIALLAAHALDASVISKRELVALGRGIRFMQREDGSFFSKYTQSGGFDRTFNSLFYPGEAMLALARLYQVDPDPLWLTSAQAAARFLVRSREPQSKVPPDHWFMIATAALEPYAAVDDALSLGQLAMRDHAIRIARTLLSHKRRVERRGNRAMIGGFDVEGRTTPTATDLEGLLALCGALPPHNRLRSELLMTAAESVAWLSRAIVQEEQGRGGVVRAIQKLADPRFAKFNRRQREIRIDYVQHTLSAMIGYRQLLAEDRLSLAGSETVTLDAFPRWMRRHVAALRWSRPLPVKGYLTRKTLSASLRLGRGYLLNNQRKDGAFNYQYDFVTQKDSGSDSSVRQAGTLWSLALLHRHQPNNTRLHAALRRGLSYFLAHSRPGPADGSLAIAYPGETHSKTGTVALVALAATEYLRAHRAPALGHNPPVKTIREALAGYLTYLSHMQEQGEGAHFAQAMALADKRIDRRHSPYFDGESLLALVKAAKYLRMAEFQALTERIALPLAWHYTVGQWAMSADPKTTKGFFQWGSMAFWEYYDAGWKQGETLGDTVLALSHWMIAIHRTLSRRRNTGYAYEGIIHAYRLARHRKNVAAARMLAATIERGLFKLSSWQVSGPFAEENPFLAAHKTKDPRAVGGVLNAANESLLRIDVTQHQIHAVLLALEHLL